MQPTRRRRIAAIGVLGLLASLVPIFLASPASAGSQLVTNACRSNATSTWSDIDWTISGTAAPNPATLGTDPTVTVSGGTMEAFIPATLLIAGYNLGLLTTGSNNIPTTVYIARGFTNAGLVANTDPGPNGTLGDGDDIVNPAGASVQVNSLSFTATTTISDPDGTPGTGDETATPISINEPLPNFSVEPTGGNIEFRQAGPGTLPTIPAGIAASTTVSPLGSIYTISSVAGGLIRANFDCQPGNADLDGPDNVLGNADDGTTFTAASSWLPYETVVVNAPPTAPVCVNESASVGVTQTITINLNDNCTDVNSDQGDTFTIAVDTTGLAGTLTATATPGVYDYTAPATDPGFPDTFTFWATDSGGLVSNTATVSITILANQCDATTSSCSLTQIVVQPVVGTTLTLDKVPGVILMSTVVLNGEAQVSTGAINQMTVTNARGDGAAWSLTAYVTDLGAPGTPTVEPIPGVVIPTCSLAGGGGSPHWLCIPGNNLGWTPSAAIAHDVIHGDVAAVTAGASDATGASDWLAQLVAAGSAGVDGLGGLLEANTLCNTAATTSGGTFTCDAALYLGVPASAGAGTYTGGLVFTLV